MKALVLIGGRGTRLRPLTPTTPKPLLPLVNRPFLRYQLDVLRGKVSEVILCAGDLKPFQAALGSRDGGLKLTYLKEPSPLGTGGAVMGARALLEKEERFLVLNGDILHRLDVGAFLKTHKRARRLATVALTHVVDPTLYGLARVAKNGLIEEFLEKPTADEVDTNLVNAGAYLFERGIFARLGTQTPCSLERSVFPALIAAGQLAAFESTGYWIDIGSLDRYLQVHLDLLGGRTRLSAPANPRPSLDGGRVVVDRTARVAETARFSGHVSVGPRCRVAAGAVLRDCVLLDGAVVGPGAHVERCILGPRAVVGARAELTRSSGVIALGKGSMVAEHSRL